jgi:pimeloyl-ACP methyl ester carboxylesterase
MEELCPLERWPDVPSNYIYCRDDRTINPRWWCQVARRRLNSEPIGVDSGHCPHMSHPAELADVLSNLA